MCFCPLVWRFDSQQTIAASFAVCLHKEARPCDGNAEFVLPPSVSQLLVPIFLNLLIITGGSRAAGAEWSWDLKQVKALLGAVREKEHSWEEQEHWQVWPNSCSEKTERSPGALQRRDNCVRGKFWLKWMWDFCVTTYKITLAMFMWFRIRPEGLFQMGTLVLPCLSLRLVYLIVSAARCLQAVDCVLFTCCGLEWEHSGSQRYGVCAMCVSHQKKSWKYFIFQNWKDMGLASKTNVFLLSLASLGF